MHSKLIKTLTFFMTFCLCFGIAQAEIVTQQLKLVGEGVRTGRTTYDYQFNVLAFNNGPDDYTNISGTASTSQPGITIIEGDIAFADINAEQTMISSDTITIRVDRRYTFSPTEVIINFTGEVIVSEPAINTRPVANAGNNQFIDDINVPVSLDGSASSDEENDPLTYQWTLSRKPDESNVTLYDDTLATAIFTPDVPGVYSFELVVNDGEYDSYIKTITIQVSLPVLVRSVEFVKLQGRPDHQGYEKIVADPVSNQTQLVQFTLTQHVTKPVLKVINIETQETITEYNLALFNQQLVEEYLESNATNLSFYEVFGEIVVPDVSYGFALHVTNINNTEVVLPIDNIYNPKSIEVGLDTPSVFTIGSINPVNVHITNHSSKNRTYEVTLSDLTNTTIYYPNGNTIELTPSNMGIVTIEITPQPITRPFTIYKIDVLAVEQSDSDIFNSAKTTLMAE